jgi:hypothetical protein
MWRIIHRDIPVKDELSRRGVICNVLCPRCLSRVETIEHTFMQCRHVSKIWFGSKLGVIFDHRHTNISEWIRNALNILNEEDLIYIAAVLYAIGFARN